MTFLSDLYAPKGKRTKDAAAINAATYNYYYTRMRNLAMSVYKWENLPDTCNARFLEKQLYYRGLAAFVNDLGIGWLSLPVNPEDTVNIYGEALHYNAFSTGYDRRFSIDDTILVRANYTCVPVDFAVRQFAARLYNIERSIDINVNAQKTPLFIVTDDKRRLTMENLYMQYDGNVPVIIADKSLDPDAFTVLRTDAPYVADKLADQKAIVWGEFLTFIGINNVGMEKRERLTNDEVNANNEHIDMQAQIGLLTRQEAAEELAARTGLDVRCVMRFSDPVEREPMPDDREIDRADEEAGD